MKNWALFMIVLLLSGCAQVTTEQEWQHLNQLPQMNQQLVWIQQQKDQQQVNVLIDEALKTPLTQENAVRIALLNNADLQAHFEHIGISKADLVQAGLWTNPHLSTLFRFPFSGGSTAIELEGLLFRLSDLWRLPLKQKMAQAMLDRTLIKIADDVLITKRETKKTYNTWRITHELYRQALKVSKLFDQLNTLSQRRHNFGYMTKMELWMVQATQQEAKILVEEYSQDLNIAKSELLRLLGLQGRTVTLDPTPLASEISLPTLDLALKHAYDNRLDLQAAMLQVKEKASHIDFENNNIFKDVGIGAGFERDTDGDNELGPALDLELPLFDQNQAQISKAIFEWRHAQKKVQVLKQNIRLEIENQLEKLSYLHRKINRLNKKIIPLHNHIVRFTEKNNQRMQINRFIVLQSQKDLMNAKIAYLKTLGEFNQHIPQLEYSMAKEGL